jgi:hypothetical protein
VHIKLVIALLTTFFTLSLLFLFLSFHAIVLFKAGQTLEIPQNNCETKSFYAPKQGVLTGTFSSNSSILLTLTQKSVRVYTIGPQNSSTFSLALQAGNYTLLLCNQGSGSVAVGIVDPIEFRYSSFYTSF